jgi:hypothetical protein
VGLIDTIITDPPYSPKALPIYEDLGQFALTALKPGGWLLCLTGWGTDLSVRQGWKAAGLEEVTVIDYYMPDKPGKGTRPTSVGTLLWQQHHKPLLWYQKPGTPADRRRGGSKDELGLRVVSKPDMDQHAHRWQQSLSAFTEIVRIYTNTSDLVCDPAMGWGTTLAACIRLNRRSCIGIERRPERYAYARRELGLAPVLEGEPAAD